MYVQFNAIRSGGANKFFDAQVDCVVSALDLHISYIKILKAATYLNRPNVLFIATNDDASLPQSDEIVMPGNSPTKKTCKFSK